MKYVYVIGSTVVGIATVATNASAVATGPAGSTEYAVPDSDPAQVGWTVTVTNGVPTFAAPAATLALLTPMQFYLAFKPAERMLIKALANTGIPVGSALVSPAPTMSIPIDPIIAEFWETYELSTKMNDTIDPNLDSVVEGLTYLSNPTAPTPAVILAARIPQIQAGIAQ